MKEKNTSNLREILFSELESLREGKSTENRAHAVSKLASQIIYASRLELENKRMEITIGHMFGKMRWNKVDNELTNIPKLAQ